MPEQSRPLVSIVINNYNYGQFVADALNSALNQTYSPIEVIAVDDGSTDNSREVMDGFGDRIIRVYKPNAGQGSCMNVGFEKSRGELVMFLDADDYLVPNVIEGVVRNWDGKAVKIHFRMDIIDNSGAVIGQDPAGDVELPSGDLKARVMARAHYDTPASSGNIYSRKYLQTILPIPEETYRRAADSYVYTLAPLHGTIGALHQVGAKYRMHGSNGFLKPRRLCNQSDLAGMLIRYDRCVGLVERFTKEKGIASTYSPKYYASPNFTRLLLLRMEEKLDLATTFRLLGYIFHAVCFEEKCGLKLRVTALVKALVVAFAPMSTIWRIYPNARPASQTTPQPSVPTGSLAVETMLPKE